MDIYSIYKFTNTINKKSYIGKTKHCPDSRKSEHIKLAETNNGYYLHNSISKYGIDNFEFIVLFQSTSTLITEKEFTNIYESLFIKENRSHFSENGYNLTWGGEGFDSESQKYYAKLRTEQGKNPFSGGKIQKESNKRLIESGKHHLLGPNSNKQMLLKGMHPSQKEGFKERMSQIRISEKEKGTNFLFNKPKISCLYCRKVMDIGNFKRSHGDECKLFKTNSSN